VVTFGLLYIFLCRVLCEFTAGIKFFFLEQSALKLILGADVLQMRDVWAGFISPLG